MNKKFSDIVQAIQEQSNLSDERVGEIRRSLHPIMSDYNLLEESMTSSEVSEVSLIESIDLVIDSAINLRLEIALDVIAESFKQEDIEDAINTLPLDVDTLKDFKLTIDNTEVVVNWEAASGKVGLQIDGNDDKTMGRAYDIEALLSTLRSTLEDWNTETTSDDLDQAIANEKDADIKKKLATLKTIIVPRLITKFANNNSDRNRLIRSLTAYITKGDDEEVITTDIDQRAILDLFFDMLDVITANRQLAQLLSRNAFLTSSYDPITESILLEAKKKSNSKKKDEDDSGVSTKLNILLRLGLVDEKLYSRAKKALGNRKAAATIPQLRNILFDLLDKLIVYIKKDPTIYNRLRINVMKEMKGTLPTKLEVIEAKKAGIAAAAAGDSKESIPEKYRNQFFTKEAWIEGYNSDTSNVPMVKTNKPEQLAEIIDKPLQEAVSYTRTADKVIANLSQHDSAAYTRLASKIEEMQQLEEDIKKIKDDIKQATRDDIQALFNAEDKVMTRVVETTSFILQLSKDPKPTETVKYREVLDELTKNLTPELIEQLENLKKKFTTETQRNPSLTMTRVKLKETFFDSLKSFYNAIVAWATTFDKKLAKLKQKVTLKEEKQMKTYKNFLTECAYQEDEELDEAVDLDEIDLINNVNDQLQAMTSEVFGSQEEAIAAVKNVISQLNLTFNSDNIEVSANNIPLLNLEGEEVAADVFSDETLADKVEAEISLSLSFEEVESGVTVTPELMLSFSEDEVVKLSDVEFEIETDSDDSDVEDDEEEDLTMTETFKDGETFNAILSRSRDHSVISKIISAKTLEAAETQLKSEYPGFEIIEIFPVRIADHTLPTTSYE